ncbi:S-adenosyl-L-methionine-dependent methyltransferase [Xylariaceae sp. FL0804]|nr:S-adenosyl-L-methionine-dependent methyltransferase [Xylariaceae sp. FL0804]
MAVTAQPDDSFATRVPSSCPANISQLLTLAWQNDVAALKPLLSVPGRASVQEPTTGETPLHAAIRACGPANNNNSDSSDDVGEAAAAQATVHELFLSGAIWNDVDSNGETPGCLADRLGQRALYALCVDAGVRAELLFGLLEGYEELESASASEDGDGDEDEDAEVTQQTAEQQQSEANGAEGNSNTEKKEEEEEEEEEVLVLESDPDRAFSAAAAAKQEAAASANDDGQVRSDEYLRSQLTYSDGKLVDAARNGVMMSWETAIMRASADALLGVTSTSTSDGAPATAATGRRRRILNVGFGMGIIDGMFAAASPAKHHIIEAHPGVLSRLGDGEGGLGFGPAWEASGPTPGAYRVLAGRWQDVVPSLLAAGELYDAVYFDTFGEDYAQLRHFFTEHVPALLDDPVNDDDGDHAAAFGFFHGLGADRRVCHDVYTRVVEAHLADAGMDVDWRELDVDMGAAAGLAEEGRGEWEGVKRRYWTLDKYRLPHCTFMR